MRRIAVAVVVVTVLLVGVVPAASPAPNPEAALRSGFNTYFTGGEATVVATRERGGEGFFHTATNAWVPDTFDYYLLPNYGIGAVRLSPVPQSPSGPFCDTNTFGIWVTVFGTKALVNSIPDQVLKLDGEVLDSIRTPFKKIVDPTGYWAEELDGEKGWWFSFGVPVYGHLDPGDYDITLEENGFTMTNTVTVEDCS